MGRDAEADLLAHLKTAVGLGGTQRTERFRGLRAKSDTRLQEVWVDLRVMALKAHGKICSCAYREEHNVRRLEGVLRREKDPAVVDAAGKIGSRRASQREVPFKQVLL